MPGRQLGKDPILNHAEVQNHHKPIHRGAIDRSLGVQRIGVVDDGVNKCRDSFVELPASERIGARAVSPQLIASVPALVFS